MCIQKFLASRDDLSQIYNGYGSIMGGSSKHEQGHFNNFFSIKKPVLAKTLVNIALPILQFLLYL